MHCAACRAQTEVEPCGACGQSPLLEGRYRLEALLSEGSFGVMFRATRVADGATVAIKAIPLRWGDGARSLERIHREARILGELDHPGIPRLHEHFEAGSGSSRATWIVQDFVAGTDLKQDPRRRSVDEVLDIVEGLLPTLAYLHSRSPPVIHRDIKPANVIQTPEGRWMLVDFGAVRDALRDAQLGGSTVAGTFGYMAPEQYMGDATPASDLYGLGALAVALLTRREPHTLSDHHNRLRWRSHTTVSGPLADFIDSLVEPDPALRPASAEDALARLRALRRGVGSTVSAVSTAPNARPLRLAEPPPRPAPDDLDLFEPPTVHAGSGAVSPRSGGSALAPVAIVGAALLAVLLLAAGGALVMGTLLINVPEPPPEVVGPLPVLEASRTDFELALSMVQANDFDGGRRDAFSSNTLRAMRFTPAQMRQVVAECDFDECRVFALTQVYPSVALDPPTSADVLELVGVCDFDGCRETVLIELYPHVSDPDRYIQTLERLDYDSTRTRVRQTLNL